MEYSGSIGECRNQEGEPKEFMWEVEYKREPMHRQCCGHHRHRECNVQSLHQMQLLLQQQIYLPHYPPVCSSHLYPNRNYLVWNEILILEFFNEFDLTAQLVTKQRGALFGR